MFKNSCRRMFCAFFPTFSLNIVFKGMTLKNNRYKQTQETAINPVLPLAAGVLTCFIPVISTKQAKSLVSKKPSFFSRFNRIRLL